MVPRDLRRKLRIAKGEGGVGWGQQPAEEDFGTRRSSWLKDTQDCFSISLETADSEGPRLPGGFETQTGDKTS